MSRWTDRARSERGATLVEFAVVAPLLVILLFGIIDLGRMVAAYSGVVSAAREAARYGSAVGNVAGGPRYVDCDGIRDAGQRVSTLVDIPDDDIAVEYDGHDPLTDSFIVFASCPSGGSGPDPSRIASGHRVKVTVTADIDLLTPIIARFFSGGEISLTVVEARSIFEGEQV